MPKIRSHSGAKKRFKKTSKGKWVYKKAGLRHLLTGMSSGKGRSMRRSVRANKTESKILDRYLPYN